MTPSLEFGVRYDGDDVETGFGVEIGGDLAFAAPESGVVIELLGRETLTGLEETESGGQCLELRAGYGIAMFDGAFIGTPELGVGLSDGGRDYRIGWRLELAGRGPGSLEFGLKATRREAANDDEPERGAMLRLMSRW